MSIWLCIPSARAYEDCVSHLEKWLERGYKLALWRNGENRSDSAVSGLAELQIRTEDYHGWGPSVNMLARLVFTIDASCDWVVTGGDDTDPDPLLSADEIGFQCSEHFRGTFGIMQSVGDRWGANEPWAKAMFPDARAYIDRICGSPWIGREFARRMNQGKGPFWPEYKHMFADEELQCVARPMGVLWQRPDLTHLHHHPRRDGSQATPDFAREIYGRPHWETSKALFESRKAAGFPGSEPIT